MYIWAPYQNGSSVSTSLPLISFASASRRTLLGRHGFDDLPSQWLETTWNAQDFRSSRAAVHCSATWKPHSHTWYIRRRKLRSETSDNMDSWKAEVRRVRRDKIRRKKMQMRKKVGKSRNTVFFQWFVAPEGRKVGSLKWRVRSQLARWEMKNCTPLWREAYFQVKMYKTHHARTTFGSWDVVKVSKTCTPLWREAHFEVKSIKKKLRVLSLFWREDVEK